MTNFLKAGTLFLIILLVAVLGYLNACPHVGTPLDLVPDQFLSEDGRHLVCATHGALFRIEDGFCVDGPGHGLHLTAVPVTVEAGLVTLPATACFGAGIRE